ncbi:MAG TPA: UvrD-helicase domain-containing protein [Myxococcota bacterium]|nr:UvrD-helicase domain-containing protein [Myxococcota bacterium]
MSDALLASRAVDARSRMLAQTEFTHPVAIEAGAGTGKTAILVARVLAWCLGPGWECAHARDPGADPVRIGERVLRGVVAITFTEAAAAEMDARIEQALGGLERGERPVGFEVSAPLDRVAALRSALDQLVVETIHAYCRRLLSAHPIEAGLHPLFEVDADGAYAAAAVRDAVSDQLGAAYERGEERVLELARLGIGPFELEAELLAQRGAGVAAAEIARDPLAPARIEALRARLAAAHQALESAAAGRLAAVNRGKAARAAAHALDAARGVIATSANGAGDLARWRADLLAAWNGSARNALEKKWAKGDFSQAESDAFADRRGAIAAAAARLASLLAHLEKIDPAALAPLAPTLASLLADAEERLRRQGRVSFEDLLTRAAALLADHPRVAADLRRGIDQLLVDEFQDTDARQCAIIASLALDGAVAERPGLFLVGDPKQSIYGWRNADLEAYECMLARVRGAGGSVGTLCVNHRSVPAILREVERVVAPVMVRAPNLQPAFEALAPSQAREAAPGFTSGGRAAVEFWLPVERGDRGALRKMRASEAAALEARSLARDLRELHDAHGVAWRSFGVLFRSRGDWDVYLGALREAEIPFSVEGDRTYYRRREIVDAAGFVCCVLDPNDQLALLTLLRSSAAGIPDAAWLPLWEAGFPKLAAELGADGEAHAALEPMLRSVAEAIEGDAPGLDRLTGWHRAAFACLEAIDALRRSFARDPGDDFVERLRAALCFEAGEGARFLGAWRAANLERFFCDLAEGLAAGEPVGALLRRIRRAVAEEETPSAEPTAPGLLDAVTVVTLHGAKGLDWDHVYLMQLHKGAARAAAPGECGRIDGVLETAWCGHPTLGFDAVLERRGRIAAAERVRTLYVGMTRARERLVVSGVWPDFLERGGDESHAALLVARDPAPPDWSALTARAVDGRAFESEACWVIPALRAAAPAAADAAADEAIEPDSLPEPAPIAASAPIPEAERRMALPIGAAVTELIEGEANGAPGARSGIPRSAARWVGTAIHAALERIDLDAGLAPWSDQRARIAAQIARAAPAAERDAAIADALACWDALARGPLAERLRALSGRILARELPVLLGATGMPDGNGALGFVSGSVDLLYRDGDGRLVVVDYKTDRDGAGAPRERYVRQGALYCRAVGQALGADPAPRFEIWWLRSGVVESVALPPPGAAALADR